VKTVRTQAIVLRRTNYGEADRIIQLLTPNGKFSVMARGARREKSKLSGGIELFSICEVVIGAGKGEIQVLTSSRLIKFFRHIIEDYDRMQFGYQVVKLVASASEHLGVSDWYDVLAETLAGLDATTVPIAMTQTWFYLHYASIMGHELRLWRDVEGQKIDEDKNYRYDVGEQGLRQIENGELNAEHIKLLRLIATKPLKILAQIGGTEKVLFDCFVVAREHAAI
jgi:DNA repair protein RecO (recombination protein O)